MKKDSFYNKSIYPVVFMFILTVVFISVISGIYLSTRELILINEGLFTKKAVLYSAGIPLPLENLQILKLYNSNVQEVKDSSGKIKYFIIKNESGTETFAVERTGAGLWGTIKAVIGVSNDLGSLTGIEFTDQNETPGLGARITEDWFKEQFRGKKPPLKFVPEGTAKIETEFDAITGATRTTTAVHDMINLLAVEAPTLFPAGEKTNNSGVENGSNK